MIYIGCDHGGVEVKNEIVKHLEEKNVSCVDVGTNSLNSVDYPDFAKKVCEKVLRNPKNVGILICKTGVGMSISANKFKGIRAALCKDATVAKLCRQHNNANVLCLGARNLSPQKAIKMVDVFLKTEFSGGRHQVRVDKIEDTSTLNFKDFEI